MATVGDVGGGASVRQIALGLMLMAAPAWADEPVRGTFAYDACAPGFLALDPDYGYLSTFTVVVREGSEVRWATEYHYPIGARCREAREALAEVVGRTTLGPGWDVAVGACR